MGLEKIPLYRAYGSDSPPRRYSFLGLENSRNMKKYEGNKLLSRFTACETFLSRKLYHFTYFSLVIKHF